jgi:hypothetical protein
MVFGSIRKLFDPRSHNNTIHHQVDPRLLYHFGKGYLFVLFYLALVPSTVYSIPVGGAYYKVARMILYICGWLQVQCPGG